MFRNYLTIAWRNLKRHKVFSLINILGLALGMVSCVLIALYVYDELSFDHFHTKANRIVRVTMKWSSSQSEQAIVLTAPPLGPALADRFPEVQNYARVRKEGPFNIRKGEEFIREERIFRTEPRFFELFTYSFLEGDPKKALAEPQSMVVSESFARRHFGIESPLGKVLTLDKVGYRVTGLLREPPKNTHLPIDALLSSDLSKETEWMQFRWYTYVLLRNAPSVPGFQSKVQDFGAEKYDALTKSWEQKSQFGLEMQRLKDIYFTKNIMMDVPKGDRQYLYTFGAVALLLLIIVLSNYVSLSTVQALKRAKEVGVRKTIGAARSQLMGQFLTESLLLVWVAGIMAFTLIQLSIPYFNDITGKSLSIHAKDDLLTVSTIWGTLMLISFLTSLYPAWLLSAFRPARVLKGVLGGEPRGIRLRQSLTVLQFTICSVLLCGLLGVYQQMHFMRNRQLGFRPDQVLSLKLPIDHPLWSLAQTFKQDLLQQKGIAQVSMSAAYSQPLSADGMGTVTVGKGEKKKNLVVKLTAVDESYFDLLEIPVQQGKTFSSASEWERKSGLVVNEAFCRLLGTTNPIGMEVSGLDSDKNVQTRIIGVIRDFHFASLHHSIEPLVFQHLDETPGKIFTPTSLLVRLNATNLPALRKQWQKRVPDYPMDYQFLDAHLESQYRRESNLMSLFGYFAGTCVILAAMGLFGLVFFAVLRRTKEIGIRKVLGASLPHILLLLSKDFIRLVLLANLIAWPLAWWGIHQWLNNYAYRIDIQPWLFVIPALLVLFIALLTVSTQTWKAARQNPVKALRYE
jgi:putative ABC transport system permease protein